MTKVHKTELLTIANPSHSQLIQRYSPHLKGVHLNDDDTKPSLPVYVVLGSGEYAKMKTETKPRINKEDEPVAELTKFGWFVMSPGKEFDTNLMMMTHTTHADYEKLCRLDVFGLRDVLNHDQSFVFYEFKEQSSHSPEGWYETSLPWKPNHPCLPNNEKGSFKRLPSLMRKLPRGDLTEHYDAMHDRRSTRI